MRRANDRRLMEDPRNCSKGNQCSCAPSNSPQTPASFTATPATDKTAGVDRRKFLTGTAAAAAVVGTTQGCVPGHLVARPLLAERLPLQLSGLDALPPQPRYAAASASMRCFASAATRGCHREGHSARGGRGENSGSVGQPNNTRNCNHTITM